MTQFTFELIFEYGAFPGIVLYLLYIILKEHKSDLKVIQEKIDKQTEKVEHDMDDLTEILNQIILVLNRMQNTSANQLQHLLLKLIELSNERKRGEK